MKLTNVYIDTGAKIPVDPGKNKGDAISVSFFTNGSNENIDTILEVFGSPRPQTITIGDMEFECVLAGNTMLIDDVSKDAKLRFRLVCYWTSTDDFMRLIGSAFEITINK